MGAWSCAATAGTWSGAATAGYMVLWYTLSMEGASLHRLGCCLGLHPQDVGRLHRVAALHGLPLFIRPCRIAQFIASVTVAFGFRPFGHQVSFNDACLA